MAVKFDFKTLEEAFEADWPVTVNVPLSGGETEQQTFLARFRLLSDEALREAEKAGGERGYLASWFVGLGVGETIDGPFEDLRERMFAAPYVRIGLQAAYRDFRMGIAAKN